MRRGGNVAGAVFLVVVFGVLCLAVFTVLTYVTADRERRLSELDALRTEEYYRADLAAVEITAALRAEDRALAETLLGAWNTPDARDDSGSPDDSSSPDDSGIPHDTSIPDDSGSRNAELLFTETENGTLAAFSLPAGGEQRLDVRLRLPGGEIEGWKKVYGGTWEADNTIILADIAEWEW